MANINVTYEEMRSMATELGNAKNDIEAQLSALQKKVESLVSEGYVTDASSKQYQESYEQFHQGAINVIGGLEGMGKFLGAAADTFEEVDQKLKGSLTQ